MLKFYEDDYIFEQTTSNYDTKVRLVDLDTFGAASQYENAVCLSFSSSIEPGGGYKAVIDLPMPIRTQEEDLFRRSNLPTLMDIPEVRDFYPLTNLKAIYCSDIIVDKDKSLKKCFVFKTSLITLPAVINPKPKSKLVKEKQRIILNIAIENKHKTIILGAWGCGIFGNDPGEIAENFHNLIFSDFRGMIETVVFAIPGKKSENYRKFEEIIFT